jgi:transketolase
MPISELYSTANELRAWIIDMLVEAKSGHPGGSLSAIDLITALWFSEMRGVPSGSTPPPGSDRDHFVLSKGHAVPALYAVLAKKGYISRESLMTLRKTGSPLQGHPDRVRMPIVEASTGSLGQGLSVAQGMALAMKMDKKPSRIFCLVGDGEIQEGQIWEAALSAHKYKLSNLCVILDANNGQIDGHVDQVMPIEPIADKWKAFGWNVLDINGHDMKQILGAYAQARELQEKGADKPLFIIARTVKGKGVPFMEDSVAWHGVAPTAEQGAKAKEEILKYQAEVSKRV